MREPSLSEVSEYPEGKIQGFEAISGVLLVNVWDSLSQGSAAWREGAPLYAVPIFAFVTGPSWHASICQQGNYLLGQAPWVCRLPSQAFGVVSRC